MLWYVDGDVCSVQLNLVDNPLVMTSSVLFYKRKLRPSAPDLFTAPVFQAGFWDLRDSGTETIHMQRGQVKIHDVNEKKLCDELEELVETFGEKSVAEQKRFLGEVSRI